MNNFGPNTDESSAQSAKQVLHGLIGVFKKLNLYSESHTVYQSALEILKKLLDEHAERFGGFRIQIERNNILYHGELLYEGGPEPTDLAFLLHRDGILWLEFQDGLEVWEIDTFYKILRDHCILDEDPEDDIVTALWAINLPSVLYEAADLELGLPEDINFADLASTSNQAADSRGDEGEPIQCETIYSTMASNVLMQTGQEALWGLTAAEHDQLRKMIAAEEELDGSDYVIEALLYILEKHCLEEDINELLETLLMELETALIHARFAYLLETVVRLKRNLKNESLPGWIANHIKQFLAKLATQPFLSGLERIGPSTPNRQDNPSEDLKRFLLHLDISAISSLGPIMLNTQSAEIQRIILETIGTMAKSDFGPLEHLISGADPVLPGRLVFLLGFLNDPGSRKALSKLVRHPSEMVRLQALKALLSRDDDAIDEIFLLIDDSDEKVRKLALNRLARDRGDQVENKLLTYLRKYNPGSKDGEHFIAVCRTLGRCGSERSIPYLTGLLFKWPLIGVLRPAHSIQRQGAIAALQALPTKQAAWLIHRNHRGFLGNFLRSAISSSA